MAFDNKLVLALIPARSGSRGIPNKNLYPIDNKFLIDFTIEAASSSKFIDHVYVSSNSKDILKHAHSRGVNIVNRPESLSGDNSTAIEVVNHFNKFLNSNNLVEVENFYLCYLQPTSPLRDSRVIDRTFKYLSKHKASSLISLTKNKNTPYKSFLIDKNGMAQSLFDESMTNKNRQELTQTYSANGAIYTFLMSKFLENEGFPSNDSYAYIMDELESLDIDSLEDIDNLKLILSKKENKKNIKIN